MSDFLVSLGTASSVWNRLGSTWLALAAFVAMWAFLVIIKTLILLTAQRTSGSRGAGTTGGRFGVPAVAEVTAWTIGIVVCAAVLFGWRSPNATDSAEHFTRAIELHNAAAGIANKGGVTMSSADFTSYLQYLRAALAEAKQADFTAMNARYAGFGDYFRDEFTKGLDDEVSSQGQGAEFLVGQALVDQWGDWYAANYSRLSGK